jgi:hypothetical protein
LKPLPGSERSEAADRERFGEGDYIKIDYIFTTLWKQTDNSTTDNLSIYL